MSLFIEEAGVLCSPKRKLLAAVQTEHFFGNVLAGRRGTDTPLPHVNESADDSDDDTSEEEEEESSEQAVEQSSEHKVAYDDKLLQQQTVVDKAEIVKEVRRVSADFVDSVLYIGLLHSCDSWRSVGIVMDQMQQQQQQQEARHSSTMQTAQRSAE
jgi:NACalpha-BTF3-like transcription factor